MSMEAIYTYRCDWCQKKVAVLEAKVKTGAYGYMDLRVRNPLKGMTANGKPLEFADEQETSEVCRSCLRKMWLLRKGVKLVARPAGRSRPRNASATAPQTRPARQRNKSTKPKSKQE